MTDTDFIPDRIYSEIVRLNTELADRDVMINLLENEIIRLRTHRPATRARIRNLPAVAS